MCICRPTWASRGTNQEHRGRSLKTSPMHCCLYICAGAEGGRKPGAALIAEPRKQRQCSRSSSMPFPSKVGCGSFSCGRFSLSGMKRVLFWLGSLCADRRWDRRLRFGLEAAARLSSAEFDDKNKAVFGYSTCKRRLPRRLGFCVVLNHTET